MKLEIRILPDSAQELYEISKALLGGNIVITEGEDDPPPPGPEPVNPPPNEGEGN